jgi:hypothetical protein
MVMDDPEESQDEASATDEWGEFRGDEGGLSDWKN